MKGQKKEHKKRRNLIPPPHNFICLQYDIIRENWVISYEESIQDNSIIENLKTQLLLERVNRERDQEIINDLRKQVGTLIEKVGDTYNTNTYNIVINPFGKENTSYITADYVNNLINSVNTCMFSFLQITIKH